MIPGMDRLANCLGLRPMGERGYWPVHENRNDERVGPAIREAMLPKTREMLDKFFDPYTVDLCALVGEPVCSYPWV